MSTQIVYHQGSHYAFDNSMHRLLTPEDGQYFQDGDWVSTAPSTGPGYFDRVRSYEIGSAIPSGVFVIRQITPPQSPNTRAKALFWIATGFLIWAIVERVIDSVMGG